MPRACNDFRDTWLEAARGGDAAGAHVRGHGEVCAVCAQWVEKVGRHLKLFDGFGSLPAPTSLGAAVRYEVEDAEARFARLFSGLAAVEAPQELEERLTYEGLAGPLLRSLAPQRAPYVLARLVEEELADPAKARARRFSDLERPEPPASLAERLRPIEKVSPRRLAPLAAALAAAVLLFWFGLRPGRSGAFEPEYSFRVRHASADAQEPLAAQWAAALGGAGVYAVERAPDEVVR